MEDEDNLIEDIRARRPELMTSDPLLVRRNNQRNQRMMVADNVRMLRERNMFELEGQRPRSLEEVEHRREVLEQSLATLRNNTLEEIFRGPSNSNSMPPPKPLDCNPLDF